MSNEELLRKEADERINRIVNPILHGCPVCDPSLFEKWPASYRLCEKHLTQRVVPTLVIVNQQNPHPVRTA